MVLAAQRVFAAEIADIALDLRPVIGVKIVRAAVVGFSDNGEPIRVGLGLPDLYNVLAFQRCFVGRQHATPASIRSSSSSPILRTLGRNPLPPVYPLPKLARFTVYP